MSELNNKKVEVEKEIDLLDLGKKLWNKRKFILKISAIGFVIGVIVAFSIPKEYTTTVILAPESSSSSGGGSMGALAAMAGINLGGSVSTGDISSDIYPNIVESSPFLLGLSNMNVFSKNRDVDTTLFTYINKEQHKAWWSYILGLPGYISNLLTTKDNNSQNNNVNKLELSKKQLAVISNLKNRLSVNVEKKTGIITLTSTMQDPMISACVADTLTSFLQSYIINYRTEKARQDLAFTEQLYSEAQKDYIEAQGKYAQYVDANQNVIFASYRINQEKLQNEMSLAYNVYNQVAQQLQIAKVKVQDETPVYTVIQPPVVPQTPSKPNKKLIVVGFIFFFSFVACGWIIGKSLFILNNNQK